MRCPLVHTTLVAAAILLHWTRLPLCPLPLPAGLPNWQSAPYISNQQDNVPCKC